MHISEKQATNRSFQIPDYLLFLLIYGRQVTSLVALLMSVTCSGERSFPADV